MNFTKTLPKIIFEFDRLGVRYALIGGLAMALQGVQRSTLDAGFIILSENIQSCDTALRKMGYRREFYSENISHYLADDVSLGRVDFLHACCAIWKGTRLAANQ